MSCLFGSKLSVAPSNTPDIENAVLNSGKLIVEPSLRISHTVSSKLLRTASISVLVKSVPRPSILSTRASLSNELALCTCAV